MTYINPDSKLGQEFWEQGRVENCPIYDFHGHRHEMFGGWLPAGEPEQIKGKTAVEVGQMIHGMMAEDLGPERVLKEEQTP